MPSNNKQLHCLQILVITECLGVIFSHREHYHCKKKLLHFPLPMFLLFRWKQCHAPPQQMSKFVEAKINMQHSLFERWQESVRNWWYLVFTWTKGITVILIDDYRIRNIAHPDFTKNYVPRIATATLEERTHEVRM